MEMSEKNLFRIYVGASSEKRVDIIIKHYTDFMGIVDGYIEGLRYMIECEKDSNSHREMGELGVKCLCYTVVLPLASIITVLGWIFL